MAAKQFSFRDRVVCAITGHKWNWRTDRVGSDGQDIPYRCDRCGHYDDEPNIVRAAGHRAAFNRWSPVTIKITRRELTMRVGVPYHRRVPALSAGVDLHYGWERTSELPGISVRFHVWRLRAGMSVGGLWQDEDGDGRALFRLWSDFTTYGLRWIGCWFGHKPEQSEWNPEYVHCARCDETLVSPNANQSEAKVAA